MASIDKTLRAIIEAVLGFVIQCILFFAPSKESIQLEAGKQIAATSSATHPLIPLFSFLGIILFIISIAILVDAFLNIFGYSLEDLISDIMNSLRW